MSELHSSLESLLNQSTEKQSFRLLLLWYIWGGWRCRKPCLQWCISYGIELRRIISRSCTATVERLGARCGTQRTQCTPQLSLSRLYLPYCRAACFGKRCKNASPVHILLICLDKSSNQHTSIGVEPQTFAGLLSRTCQTIVLMASRSGVAGGSWRLKAWCTEICHANAAPAGILFSWLAIHGVVLVCATHMQIFSFELEELSPRFV